MALPRGMHLRADHLNKQMPFHLLQPLNTQFRVPRWLTQALLARTCLNSCSLKWVQQPSALTLTDWNHQHTRRHWLRTMPTQSSLIRRAQRRISKFWATVQVWRRHCRAMLQILHLWEAMATCHRIKVNLSHSIWRGIPVWPRSMPIKSQRLDIKRCWLWMPSIKWKETEWTSFRAQLATIKTK